MQRVCNGIKIYQERRADCDVLIDVDDDISSLIKLLPPFTRAQAERRGAEITLRQKHLYIRRNALFIFPKSDGTAFHRFLGK